MKGEQKPKGLKQPILIVQMDTTSYYIICIPCRWRPNNQLTLGMLSSDSSGNVAPGVKDVMATQLIWHKPLARASSDTETPQFPRGDSRY